MKNNTKPILRTRRLTLRQFRDSDTAVMASISADERVMTHFPKPINLNETELMIQKIHTHHQLHGYSLYAVEITDSSTFIGFVGLHSPSFIIPHFIPKALPIMEIAWRLAFDHWSKGYATEAAHAVLKHGFSDCNLKEIIAFTTKNNKPSRHVMKKIGLTHDEKNDFMHPGLDDTCALKPHVLYRSLFHA